MAAIDRQALAKSYPEEDIQTHTDCLLAELTNLKKLYPNLFAGWDSLYELLYFACIYHDLGKLYPPFQRCLRNRVPYINGLPHGLLSLALIDTKWLHQEKELKQSDLKLLFQAVAYHHDRKMPFENSEIEKEFIQLEEPFKRFHYDKVPTRFLAPKIKKKYFIVQERVDKKDHEQFFRFIMLQGLLNRLDYAASAHVPVEHPNDFLPEALSKLMQRWQQCNPESDWNDLQKYMASSKDKNVLVLAQTGMGKTEAGLLWLGNAKGFFTLPLKSAINAMYDRIAKGVVLDKQDERVGLLHSDTYIRYLELSEQSQVINGNDGDGKSSTELYFTRTKQLSLPLTICTLDQLFGFVFLYRGFEHKLATLAYSKIIIDEVQMYSPELTAYLVLGLSYISRIGGQFAILTATLPKFFISLLQEQGIRFESPRMFVNNRIRHSLKVIVKEINAQDIAALSREYKGRKILVVCNTIKNAVKLYHQLQWDKDKELPLAEDLSETDGKVNGEQNYGVYLLHSHFIRRDRAKKENHILKMGKKESTESGIWIATQIVEASLDIDFDLLFTELSDLNGLFQRLGRCYRDRDLKNLPYNCFIFTEKCSGVGSFIDKEIHRLSKEALLKVDGVITEEQKMAMIEELYTKEKLPDYYKKIKDTIQYVNTHSPWEIDKKEAGKKFRDIDTVSVIPRKVYEDHREEINQAIEKLQKDYSEMEGTKAREIRAKARRDILNLTVDISKYLYMNMETQVIHLSDYEQILIAECDYNSQEGIIRPALKKKAEIVDFSFHSF